MQHAVRPLNGDGALQAQVRREDRLNPSAKVLEVLAIAGRQVQSMPLGRLSAKGLQGFHRLLADHTLKLKELVVVTLGQRIILVLKAVRDS